MGQYDGLPIWMMVQQWIHHNWELCENNIFGTSPFLYFAIFLMLLLWICATVGRTIVDSMIAEEPWWLALFQVVSMSGLPPAILLLLMLMYPPLYHDPRDE